MYVGIVPVDGVMCAGDAVFPHIAGVSGPREVQGMMFVHLIGIVRGTLHMLMTFLMGQEVAGVPPQLMIVP